MGHPAIFLDPGSYLPYVLVEFELNSRSISQSGRIVLSGVEAGGEGTPPEMVDMRQMLMGGERVSLTLKARERRSREDPAAGIPTAGCSLR